MTEYPLVTILVVAVFTAGMLARPGVWRAIKALYSEMEDFRKSLYK